VYRWTQYREAFVPPSPTESSIVVLAPAVFGPLRPSNPAASTHDPLRPAGTVTATDGAVALPVAPPTAPMPAAFFRANTCVLTHDCAPLFDHDSVSGAVDGLPLAVSTTTSEPDPERLVPTDHANPAPLNANPPFARPVYPSTTTTQSAAPADVSVPSDIDCAVDPHWCVCLG
jgi:hypothetical protein